MIHTANRYPDQILAVRCRSLGHPVSPSPQGDPSGGAHTQRRRCGRRPMEKASQCQDPRAARCKSSLRTWRTRKRITYRWLCTQEPGPWGIAAPRRQSSSGEEFLPRSPSIVTAGDTLCSSVLRRRYPTTTRGPNDHAAELPMATACFLPPPSLLSAWW